MFLGGVGVIDSLGRLPLRFKSRVERMADI